MTEKVYFVGAPGRIKIGFTRKPEKRLLALRRADMEELEVLAIVDGSRSDENGLHKMLADHRLRGEWFHDNDIVRDTMARFIAGEIRFAKPVDIEDQPRPSPRDVTTDVVNVAMGELRFLVDEIQRRMSAGIPASDLVWFAKFLTDEIIDPLTSPSPLLAAVMSGKINGHDHGFDPPR